MGEFFANIGQYWWLIFIAGPMIGGAATSIAKYNEARRRDRIELERVRRMGPITPEAAPHHILPPRPELRPSTSVSDADIERLAADHAAIEQRWLSYELDVAKLIDFPLMTDMREQVTRDFHTARRRAIAVQPSDLEALRDRDRYVEYRDAVVEFETAFDIALGEAKRRRQHDFSPEEQRRLATAQQLLALAMNDSATVPERQSAYQQAKAQLDGLLSLPQATTDDIEHRIAGELEA